MVSDMAKFIVHVGTDTIVAVDECLLLDIDDIPDSLLADLTGDEYFDDNVVIKLANQYGTPLVEMEEV